LTVNGRSVDLPTTTETVRKFHLFLDGSVAELICDDLQAITTRIYRKPDGPLHISADSAIAHFRQLAAWQLKPISPDRLTN
jgi:hypothetical protein